MIGNKEIRLLAPAKLLKYTVINDGPMLPLHKITYFSTQSIVRLRTKQFIEFAHIYEVALEIEEAVTALCLPSLLSSSFSHGEINSQLQSIFPHLYAITMHSEWKREK